MPSALHLYACREERSKKTGAFVPAGILLGVESGIPQEMRGEFSPAVTSQVIAISGYETIE